MSLWIKLPNSNEYSTTLTIALAGFVFAMMYSAACLVAAWVLNNSSFLSSVAMVDAAILTPSLAAYTSRRFIDSKYGNGSNDITTNNGANDVK